MDTPMPGKQGRLLAGSCLCGAVGYVVEDAFRYALNCHCADCRRATGSAFKPFAGVARSKLQVTRGAADVLIYGNLSEAHDIRCRRCGSLLFSVINAGADVHVTLGTLVDPPSIRPAAHIFVGDKAPWDLITDDLPQYEGHVPPST